MRPRRSRTATLARTTRSASTCCSLRRAAGLATSSTPGSREGYSMSLRVAVQMDPLESINIAGDSSFALMLSAQARGHRLWHYDVRSLAWEDGRLTAWARPVRVQRVAGEHYGFEGDGAKIDLASDIDVVLMRQDPPFDLGYISAALLLDRLKGETLVVNDPRSVI